MEISDCMARSSGEEEEEEPGDRDGDGDGVSAGLVMDLTAKNRPSSRLIASETRPKEPYPRGKRRIHLRIFMGGEDSTVFFRGEASMVSFAGDEASGFHKEDEGRKEGRKGEEEEEESEKLGHGGT